MYDLVQGRENGTFVVGSPRVLRNGADVAFLATGETVIHALLAGEFLKSRNISSRVASMHTIKPLDAQAVLEVAGDCAAIVTVEEHSINGGLGEACAAILMQAGKQVRFKIVGIPDEYTVTGSQADIFRHYGISMEALAQTALKLLG
jgi:transketolase